MPITGSQPAQLLAQAGIMRAGTSRANVTTPKVFVSIAGVQYATARAVAGHQVDQDTLTINEVQGDTPNTATFTMRGVQPTDGQDVVITLGSINNLDRQFGGTILIDDHGYIGTPANGNDVVSVIDYTWQLMRETITQRWTNVSATAIAQAIIAHANRGFTVALVAAGLPVLDEFTVTNQTHAQALTALCARFGGSWKATYSKDVRLGIASDPSQTDPITLTAAHPTLTAFKVRRDLGSVITRQPVEGGGVNALTDIGVGETALPVDDASWYNPAGGSVVTGPQRLTYTGLQGGGSGSLVGPGAAPSAAPGGFQHAGVGIDDGAHTWAYTWVTAAGESLPSPVSAPFVCETLIAPAVTPAVVFVPNAFFPAIAAGTVLDYALGFAPAVGDGTVLSPLTAVASITATGAHGYYSISFTVTADMVGRATLIARRDNGGSYFYTGVNDFQARDVGTTWTIIDTLLTAPAFGTSGTYTVSAQANQFLPGAIALGPASVTSRKVYRTPTGSTQLKLQQTVANNTVTIGAIDATADASLGANAPTSDTSGLTQPTGQINAGSTSLLTAGVGAFNAGGGWAILGQQIIRYVGITGNTLTGIPASGPGSLMSTAKYGDHVDAAATLIGIPASGAGSILYPIKQGDPVNVRVVMDDLAAQAAIATLIGGSDDGVIEGTVIQDGRISETEARARGVAQLALSSAVQVSVYPVSRDNNMRAGRNLGVSLTAPTSVTGTFLLQQVAVGNFQPALFPTRTAQGSSKRFSLDDLLRIARGAA